MFRKTLRANAIYKDISWCNVILKYIKHSNLVIITNENAKKLVNKRISGNWKRGGILKIVRSFL